MSAAPRGGGPRSMGASLLDQVLAETLDPAYRQAAEARAAREREGPEPAPGRARRARRRGRLLVALVMAIAGLLAAITYDQASAGAKGRHQVRSALLGDIDRESRTADALTAQLDRLHADVDRTREAALAASTVGQDALSRLASAELAAAAVPVSGPGLVVTLANAAPNADSDPVGGGTAANSAGVVRDTDLQLVANALWAAGAEAVSIDGQRLGPTSTIRLAGAAVLVDFWPVTNPYRVSAIGDPDALATRFLADPEVQALAVVSQSYGLRFEFAKEKGLSLPAATPSDLRYASAVTAAASSTTGGTPAPPTGTAPGRAGPTPPGPPSSAAPSAGSASTGSASAGSASGSGSTRARTPGSRTATRMSPSGAGPSHSLVPAPGGGQ